MRRKSCRSHGERILTEILKAHNVEFIREKTFLECKSLKNRPLRFDFFLPKYNVLIEFQGKHHYEPINKYYRAKRSHEKTIIHDNLKLQFIKNYHYYLLQIPYWEIDNIQNVLYEYFRRFDD